MEFIKWASQISSCADIIRSIIYTVIGMSLSPFIYAYCCTFECKCYFETLTYDSIVTMYVTIIFAPIHMIIDDMNNTWFGYSHNRVIIISIVITLCITMYLFESYWMQMVVDNTLLLIHNNKTGSSIII